MQPALALGALTAATLGLALGIEPFPTWYYHFAWWSYIVAADGLNRRLVGRSLLRDRPGEFLRLAAFSVMWWTLFEAINLRLGNWYYVMDHPQRAVRWTGGVLAFATVLPGIIETVELIENLGWLKSVRAAPLGWGPRKEAACLGLGLACLTLPLAWPEVFFPLTWGSFVFIIEPWNRRHAHRSFLRDLEAGEAGPFCRTLLAGLFCGLLWEVWNFWARTKWLYTVPGFEEWKLFEMPLLGFLGFPPFAVECLAVVRFLGTIERRLGAAAKAAALPAGAALTLLVFVAVDPVVVDSSYLPVAELEVLPGELRQRLVGSGLTRPEDLLRALETAEKRDEVARRTGLPAEDLARARDSVALVMHRGLGPERALQLARLGIHDLEDIARWQPEALAASLRALGPRPADRFLERRARVWLEGLGGGSTGLRIHD